jgi:hypothetical protein
MLIHGATTGFFREKDNESAREGYPRLPRLNLGDDKRRSSRGIHLVVPVLGGDDDTVVTDVVAGVADDEDLGRGDDTECLVPISVSESNDFATLARSSKTTVENLPALTRAAVAAESLCVAVCTS